MTLDRDRLRTKRGDISGAVMRLQRLLEKGREMFLRVPGNQNIARSPLLFAIEAALHIHCHLCAKRFVQFPDAFPARRGRSRATEIRGTPSRYCRCLLAAPRPAAKLSSAFSVGSPKR